MSGRGVLYKIILAALALPSVEASKFRTWSLVPRFDIPSLLDFWISTIIIACLLVSITAILLLVSLKKGEHTHSTLKPVLGAYVLKRFFPPAFIFGAIFALLSLHRFEERFLILGAYILILLILLLLALRSWRAESYELNGDKLVTASGALKGAEIHVSEIRGVMVKRPSIIDHLLGTGEVIFSTGSGTLRWRDVAYPEALQQVRRLISSRLCVR